MPEDGVLTPFDTVYANREAWKEYAQKLEGALRAYAKFDDVIAALSDARREAYQELQARLAVLAGGEAGKEKP